MICPHCEKKTALVINSNLFFCKLCKKLIDKRIVKDIFVDRNPVLKAK